MQVTLGDDGSGFSKVDPRFFPFVGNMGEAWPAPFKLPLLLSLLLREEESEIWGVWWSLARPGLRMDLEIFIEEEDERRDVKQIKSSPVALLLLLLILVVRWGLSESISLCFPCFFSFHRDLTMVGRVKDLTVGWRLEGEIGKDHSIIREGGERAEIEMENVFGGRRGDWRDGEDLLVMCVFRCESCREVQAADGSD